MSEELKHLKQYGTGAGGAWARPSLPAGAVYGTGDAVISFHRDSFSTCRYCACAKQYFTVCIVRCVYRAELILGR